jgi:hypothetical protein
MRVQDLVRHAKARNPSTDTIPGLDRIVQFFLNLPNIRLATVFPRDPGRIAP